jgi:L-threonylcarbamoyladenylate synthase
VTTVLTVDAARPSRELIARAAEELRAGGLVAFPTETVYGLGAIATDAKATARVFVAKDRPATSPLIVHVASIEQARKFAASWPDAAQRLAEAFWPGPLSLVLPKSSMVPAAVAGGGDSVAIRAPAHAVALALIVALGEGIAAPSANRSSRLPPVRPQHVLKGLDGRIEMLLDAGACPGGMESTVLDLSTAEATVLRRGAISIERIGKLVAVRDASVASVAQPDGWIRQVRASEIEARASAQGGTAGALMMQGRRLPEGIEAIVLGDDPSAFGAGLYDALHDLEDAGCETVWVETLPASAQWDAIRDRLSRFGRG